MDAIGSILLAMVARTATPAAAAWLAAEHAAIASPLERGRFAAAFAGAGRRLGTAAVAARDDEAGALRGGGFALAPATGVDECGRAALVLAAVAALPADAQVELVSGLVRRGDVRERMAVLRVLAALPDRDRFTALAIDALRTNVVDVFAAVACDNPLPARCFDERAFGQMVLKALLMGAPLARIVELD